MSKVPCDPAGGNLRFSKHRRVACMVPAYGVVMDTSVLSLGYLRPYPSRRPKESHSRGQQLCKFIGTKETVYLRKRFHFPNSSICNVKQGNNRPWPTGSFCGCAH